MDAKPNADVADIGYPKCKRFLIDDWKEVQQHIRTVEQSVRMILMIVLILYM